MPDVHRLRVFCAVVAAGSVNRAAANLGYTPSAISQQLAALQRETGLRLLERSGRGIEVTATGQRLAEEAAGVLERLATLDSVVTDLREGRSGHLSVSYFTSAGAAWIPPVVAALTREFPDLRLELRLAERPGAPAPPTDMAVFVVPDSSGSADPSVPAGSSRDSSRGYDVHPLLEEPYVAVLPDGHRLAGRSRVGLRELADEPWVDNDVTRGPCRQVVMDACASVGFTPAFRIETPDYPTAISFVATGVGVTVLPHLAVAAPLPPGVVAVPVVDPVPVRRIAVKVRESLRHHPAANRFLALLRARVH